MSTRRPLGDRIAGAGLRVITRGALRLKTLAVGRDTAANVDQSAGRALLEETYSIDLHAHPALIRSLASTSIDGHGRALRSGQVGAVVLAAVGDLPVLGWRPRRSICAVRAARPGELFEATWRQLTTFADHLRRLDRSLVRDDADLGLAAANHVPACLLAIEGCDFLEGQLDRVHQAYARGVRLLQLVHYRVNELGDIQTDRPVHHGLTTFGRTVVREMNRLGMVIDLSHATLRVAEDTVETSAQPVIISHANIQDATRSPRFVTPEHARLVAEHGGLVGAWPVSTATAGFRTFIDHIARLVDTVGIDHVGIGTDLDGTGPYALFTDYAQWPSIPAALLDRGFARHEVAKVMGANFRRVLSNVTGPTSSTDSPARG